MREYTTDLASTLRGRPEKRPTAASRDVCDWNIKRVSSAFNIFIGTTTAAISDGVNNGKRNNVINGAVVDCNVGDPPSAISLAIALRHHSTVARTNSNSLMTSSSDDNIHVNAERFNVIHSYYTPTNITHTLVNFGRMRR
jgi:hypothetical protein